MRFTTGRYFIVSDPESMFYDMLFYSIGVTVEYHDSRGLPNPLVTLKGSLTPLTQPIVFCAAQLTPVDKKQTLFTQLKHNWTVIHAHRDAAILAMKTPVTVTANYPAVTGRVIDPQEVF